MESLSSTPALLPLTEYNTWIYFSLRYGRCHGRTRCIRKRITFLTCQNSNVSMNSYVLFYTVHFLVVKMQIVVNKMLRKNLKKPNG